MKIITRLLQNGERRVEVSGNLESVFVPLALGEILIKDFLLVQPKPQLPPQAQAANRGKDWVGTSLTDLPIKWDANQQTLVMALSSNCHFCTESAPFYKRLA